MFKDDGTVIHFNNPKVQASLTANTFAISGHGEIKRVADMVPGILNQLRVENLKSLVNAEGTGSLDDDEVPQLVGNFDDQIKQDQ